jgi:hypothetical protein
MGGLGFEYAVALAPSLCAVLLSADLTCCVNTSSGFAVVTQ